MPKKQAPLDAELKRVRAQIAAELDALDKLREAAKPHEQKLASLRAYEVGLVTTIALSNVSANPSQAERYEGAEVLFSIALQKMPMAKALRQLFEDAAPEAYDRESILALVQGVLPHKTAGTVYSTLSQLVAAGAIEKVKGGYRGIPK